MAKITFKGNPISTVGTLPERGKQAPDFSFVKTDLSGVSRKDLAGKKVVLNIFPSVDTAVCATSVRRFNQLAYFASTHIGRRGCRLKTVSNMVDLH